MKVEFCKFDVEDDREETIGTAWISNDGSAKWDRSLDGYLEHYTNRDASGKPVSPQNGEQFLKLLPLHFSSAPYCWARLVA